MRSNRFEIFSTSVGQLVKSVTALKSRKMAKYGLKGTGALCLCQILESESGLTATELRRLGEIDKAQVSRCMNELSDKGLVYLDEQEGRKYKQKYRLTSYGDMVARDVQKTVDLLQGAVRKGISQEELEAFYRTLYKLCDNFDEVLANEAAGEKPRDPDEEDEEYDT